MKKKFNPELLKEEQNRFKRLLEYDFYQERKEIPSFKKDIILGDLEEAEDEPTEEPADVAGAKDIAADLGVDAPGEETTADIPEPEAEEPADAEMPAEEPMDTEMPAEEPAGDEVEVDVTSLVKSSEDAKQSADMANKSIETLLQKFDELESRIGNMSAITNKIEDLEKEIVKRNPTPVEKLEMRSLSSYPFNQKLTDYWADKEGPYNVMGEKKKKEYVLTKDDVDAGYSEANIKKSFSSQDSPYEEEEIKDYTEENF